MGTGSAWSRNNERAIDINIISFSLVTSSNKIMGRVQTSAIDGKDLLALGRKAVYRPTAVALHEFTAAVESPDQNPPVQFIFLSQPSQWLRRH